MNKTLKIRVLATSGAAFAVAGGAAALLIPAADSSAVPVSAPSAAISALSAPAGDLSTVPSTTATMLRSAATQVGVTGALHQVSSTEWAAQGPNATTCLFSVEPEGALMAGCSDAATTAAGGAWLTKVSQSSGAVTQIGIVPDGVTQVQATGAGGQVTGQANVSGNGYRLTYPAGSDSIRFAGPSAPATRPITPPRP